MKHHPETVAASAVPDPGAVRPAARRPLLGAILTDVHFWIPVVVLVLGVGLLAFIS